MLIDTRDLTPGRVLPYDVCIVGAGAAGITLARALRSDRVSICLLESGGFNFDGGTQALYEGVLDAAGFDPATYLSSSRLRFFGGSTNHWEGMCRPLDPIDFAVRPWVAHSGWPINRDDLAPYYERAAGVLQFSPFDEGWGDVTLDAQSLVPPDGVLIGRSFRGSPPTRFGTVYRQELVEARSIDILLHANAVHLDLNEAGTSVERVQVAGLNGTRVTVTARLFVLATGGIENARLLLASNSVHTSGLGNGSDCVGRYFMEHPEITVAQLLTTSPAVLEDIRSLANQGALLSLSERTQREHELLNAAIDLLPPSDWRESEAGGVPLDIGDAVEYVDRLGVEGAPEVDPTDAQGLRRCLMRIESAPKLESRVTLEDRETDALGMRRSRLTLVLGALESRTVVRTTEIVARELGARQGGRLMLALAEGVERQPVGGPGWTRIRGGSHHMGTTRMSDTPATGVVDRDCTVHGVPNLYVAGSSVFPTCGMANPTFTIVALALRMAEHIAARLANG